jgi:ubiquinone/menaquinone biosynthesis C-methylase UbiE
MPDEIGPKRIIATQKGPVEHWLDFSAYVTKYRYNSYWHQLDEVFRSGPCNVLEIGVGSNVTSTYLSYKGIEVVTIDLEARLGPAVVASVRHLPFEDQVFDTVVCCQVLEHLPFDEFDGCLSELRRVCKRKLVLSLPDKTPGISMLVRIPNFVFWEFCLSLPWAIREPIKRGREHYWEIGRWGYSRKKVLQHVKTAGFFVERTYRVPEYPYHRFFIATPYNT